eukprot:g31352.t1
MHAEIQAKRTPEELSVKQLLDCVPNPRHCGGRGGCEGASAELAFQFVSQHGLTSAETTAAQNLCASPPAPYLRVQGFGRLRSNHLRSILEALTTRGPLVVGVDASHWDLYGQGVFDACERDATINHAAAQQKREDTNGHIQHGFARRSSRLFHWALGTFCLLLVEAQWSETFMRFASQATAPSVEEAAQPKVDYIIGNIWQNRTWKRALEVDPSLAAGPAAKGVERLVEGVGALFGVAELPGAGWTVPPEDMTPSDLADLASAEVATNPAKVLEIYRRHVQSGGMDATVLIRAFAQLGFLFDPNSFFSSADRQILTRHRDFRCLAHDLWKVRADLPDAVVPLLMRLGELANRDADDETTVHDWARAAFALVMSNHCDAEGPSGVPVLPLFVSRACQLLATKTELENSGWAQFFLYQTLYCVDVEKPACEEAVKRAMPMWIQEPRSRAGDPAA